MRTDVKSHTKLPADGTSERAADIGTLGEATWSGRTVTGCTPLLSIVWLRPAAVSLTTEQSSSMSTAAGDGQVAAPEEHQAEHHYGHLHGVVSRQQPKHLLIHFNRFRHVNRLTTERGELLLDEVALRLVGDAPHSAS